MSRNNNLFLIILIKWNFNFLEFIYISNLTLISFWFYRPSWRLILESRRRTSINISWWRTCVIISSWTIILGSFWTILLLIFTTYTKSSFCLQSTWIYISLLWNCNCMVCSTRHLSEFDIFWNLGWKLKRHTRHPYLFIYKVRWIWNICFIIIVS